MLSRPYAAPSTFTYGCNIPVASFLELLKGLQVRIQVEEPSEEDEAHA